MGVGGGGLGGIAVWYWSVIMVVCEVMVEGWVSGVIELLV